MKKIFIGIFAAVLVIVLAGVFFLFTRPVIQIGRAFQKTLRPVSAGASLSVYTDEYGIYDVDTWLDDQALVLHSEEFPGDDLYYPYTTDKSGSGIEELIGRNAVLRMDAFLKMYRAVCSGGINRRLLKDLRSLRFERTEEKELHVDNTALHLHGLRTQITADFLRKLMADMGEETDAASDLGNVTVTFYLSGGYAAAAEIQTGTQNPTEILFEEKGKRISITGESGNELSLTFKENAAPLSKEGARDLSQMTEADLQSFVMRMVIRGSGMGF